MAAPRAAASPLLATERPVLDLSSHPSPHPFVRRGLVARRPSGLPATALVTIRDPLGTVLGDAFWNETSDIALRRLTQAGRPFDAAALHAAVDRAATLRESLPGLSESSDAWRAVHAEGDGLSGLVVDRFGSTLSVELHSAGWVAILDEVLAALHARFGTSQHQVVLSERTAVLEGVAPLVLRSEGCPERVRIGEHGVRYEVHLASGHKTGFFCDQRENRAELATRVAGADVLDVCAYTGGFALAALVRGTPRSVTAVELDETALAGARTNANLNQVRANLVQADAFDWLRQMAAGERRFDVIVVDPPKFVPTRRDEERGQAKYHDLNRLAVRLLRPGGWFVTCSCSGLVDLETFTALVRVALRKEGRQAAVLSTTGAGPDHPVLLECPESGYLKVLWARVW